MKICRSTNSIIKAYLELFKCHFFDLINSFLYILSFFKSKNKAPAVQICDLVAINVHISHRDIFEMLFIIIFVFLQSIEMERNVHFYNNNVKLFIF